jgi:DNA ligase-1
MPTLFKSLAELLEKVQSTKKRLEITDITANFLKRLDTDEVEPAVSMFLGRALPKWSQKTLEVSWVTLSGVLQRVTGVDWNIFHEAFAGTGVLVEKTLTINEVRRLLQAIAGTAGSGSRQKKEHLIITLLSQASPVEAKYLVKIFVGEMRTGLHEGLMEQAIAKAFNAPLVRVQNANIARSDIGEVATIAKTNGEEGLLQIGFQVLDQLGSC